MWAGLGRGQGVCCPAQPPAGTWNVLAHCGVLEEYVRGKNTPRDLRNVGHGRTQWEAQTHHAIPEKEGLGHRFGLGAHATADPTWPSPEVTH